MTTYCKFAVCTLNENISRFLRVLKHDNIQSKLITQLDDLNFLKTLEKAVPLQNGNLIFPN